MGQRASVKSISKRFAGTIRSRLGARLGCGPTCGGRQPGGHYELRQCRGDAGTGWNPGGSAPDEPGDDLGERDLPGDTIHHGGYKLGDRGARERDVYGGGKWHDVPCGDSVSECNDKWKIMSGAGGSL